MFFPEVFGTLRVSPAVAAGAGVLVGIGTSMGSGCTSGHGVCGLPRLAARSWVAASTFILTGMVTASLINSVPALHDAAFNDAAAPWWLPGPDVMPWVAAAAAVGLVVEGFVSRASTLAHEKAVSVDSKVTHAGMTATTPALALSWGLGAAFAAGLGLAGMLNPAKVLGFLTPAAAEGWDTSLAFVLGGAVAVTSVAFPLIFTRDAPLLGERWHLPTSSDITPSLVLGAVLFGAGWGTAGFCPGPSIASVGSGSPHAVANLAGLVVGMGIYQVIKPMLPSWF